MISADLFISPHNSPLISDDSESLILRDQKLERERERLILSDLSFYRRSDSRSHLILLMILIAGVIWGDTRLHPGCRALESRRRMTAEPTALPQS